MIYLIAGLTGLLFIVALFTYLRRNKKNEEQPVEVPSDCCGAHAICEKGLKKADPHIDYFDDEELDAYQHISADAYTNEQIDIFRDILYTLPSNEIEEWLISLEKRNINLPNILRSEAIEMIE